MSGTPSIKVRYRNGAPAKSQIERIIEEFPGFGLPYYSSSMPVITFSGDRLNHLAPHVVTKLRHHGIRVAQVRLADGSRLLSGSIQLEKVKCTK